MRPINCGFVNPVKRLFSLGYKVQQTFFVPGKKKHKLGEQRESY